MTSLNFCNSKWQVMVRHTEKQKAPGDGWYAHSLLIKNNQEKHALNSKTTKKKRENERMKKTKQMKTGGKFKYITALMSYCQDKKVFFYFFLPVILFSCYSFVKTTSKPDRRRLLERWWETKPQRSSGSSEAWLNLHNTRIHTHRHTHIDTHLSGLTHTYPALVCRQLQT